MGRKLAAFGIALLGILASLALWPRIARSENGGDEAVAVIEITCSTEYNPSYNAVNRCSDGTGNPLEFQSMIMSVSIQALGIEGTATPQIVGQAFAQTCVPAGTSTLRPDTCKTIIAAVRGQQLDCGVSTAADDLLQFGGNFVENAGSNFTCIGTRAQAIAAFARATRFAMSIAPLPALKTKDPGAR